jgi:hypothetical protein
MSPASLLQHCAAKGGTSHNCIKYYLEKLDIKPGKTWPEQSTSDRKHRGDDKSIYGFEIDRKGNSGSVIGES